MLNPPSSTNQRNLSSQSQGSSHGVTSLTLVPHQGGHRETRAMPHSLATRGGTPITTVPIMNANPLTSKDVGQSYRPTSPAPSNSSFYTADDQADLSEDEEQLHGLQAVNADLAYSIPGLFRVLDLIQERGSGGLVDKIVIEQDGLSRLIHDLQPGAYTSITKVDFSALDRVQIRPIGIYGSRSAIVDFLMKKGIVDAATATTMLQPADISAEGMDPSLRSGIYVLRHGIDPQLYAVYWPEDDTWDDQFSRSVRRNRVAFMRYLTKLSDQVACTSHWTTYNSIDTTVLFNGHNIRSLCACQETRRPLVGLIWFLTAKRETR